MAAMISGLRALMTLNTGVLWLGRTLAWIALVLMVLAILAQVFFRYVLNNPLPWPEEGARFLMLWMTGLAAPSAYRWGGFVAIDMFVRMLPLRIAHTLNLILLAMGAVVIAFALQKGWSDMTGFGGRFSMSALKVPFGLIGGETIPFKKAWMMASLVVGMIMMAMVAVELMLRSVLAMVSPDADLPEVPGAEMARAD